LYAAVVACAVLSAIADVVSWPQNTHDSLRTTKQKMIDLIKQAEAHNIVCALVLSLFHPC
jgi:hypothetical protein